MNFYDEEIEKAVLGCIMIDKPELIMQLSEDDFHNGEHKLLAKTIKESYKNKEPIDKISMSFKIKPEEKPIFLGIDQDIETTANSEHYVKLLKELSSKRKIDKILKQNIYDLEKGKGFYEAKTELINSISLINTLSLEKNTFSESLQKNVRQLEHDYLKGEDRSMYFGFSELDNLTGGLRKEEFTIIAARPSQGKSAFLGQLILNLANRNQRCLLFSYEMSEFLLQKRMLAHVSKIDGMKLMRPHLLEKEDFEKIANSSIELSKKPICIETSCNNIEKLKEYCYENKDNFDILFVDYLGLIRSGIKGKKYEEVSDISSSLKLLAMDLKKPVVCAAQLNRDSVKNSKDPSEPHLHHLRDSGTIEQDADNVYFLHNPKEENKYDQILDIELIVAKQKSGIVCKINLVWVKNEFKFRIKEENFSEVNNPDHFQK